MAVTPKTINILGSTGSVGRSTVDLILSCPEQYDVQAVTAYKNAEALAAQAMQLNAKTAIVADPHSYNGLKEALAGTNITAAAGSDALLEAASMPADWTMAAIVGMAGLAPLMQAIKQGNHVAIANKEPLVAAGPFVIKAAEQSGATLLPVDSEHNAIFQVFDTQNRRAIRQIVLTASGGPFLNRPREDLETVTPAEAIAHPNWAMGAKISVDSATMMNKALEVIEAHYLFDMPPEKISVLIHPQSIIHSLVAYEDGSVLAQMGAPDMRTPIAHALAWPNRMKTTGQHLDISEILSLELKPLEPTQFPAVGLAYDCLQEGIPHCVAMNAANEVAVAAFLDGAIGYLDIMRIITESLEKIAVKNLSNIDDVIAFDAIVRKQTESLLAGENTHIRGVA